MLQLLKHTPKRLMASLLTQQLIATLRYRVQGWTAPPLKKRPRAIRRGVSKRDANFRDMSFTFAVIALSARIACADGDLTQQKYVAFRECFPLIGDVCGKIRALFALACNNPTPYEHYVTQIRYGFKQNRGVYQMLIDRLFRIASADGELGREAERIIATAAHMLDLTTAEYAAIRARYHRPQAHQVLGLSHRAPKGIVKKRYYELMQRYHPDRFAAFELSPELELLLKGKAAEINNAYKLMAKKAA